MKKPAILFTSDELVTLGITAFLRLSGALCFFSFSFLSIMCLGAEKAGDTLFMLSLVFFSSVLFRNGYDYYWLKVSAHKSSPVVIIRHLLRLLRGSLLLLPLILITSFLVLTNSKVAAGTAGPWSILVTSVLVTCSGFLLGMQTSFSFLEQALHAKWMPIILRNLLFPFILLTGLLFTLFMEVDSGLYITASMAVSWLIFIFCYSHKYQLKISFVSVMSRVAIHLKRFGSKPNYLPRLKYSFLSFTEQMQVWGVTFISGLLLDTHDVSSITYIFRLCSLITLSVIIINFIFLAKISKAYHEHSYTVAKKLYVKSKLCSILLGCGAGLVVFFFFPYLSRILEDEITVETSVLLVFLAAQLIHCYFGLSAQVMFLTEESHKPLSVSIGYFILMFICEYIGGLFYGIIGIGYGYLLASLLYKSSANYIVRKAFSKEKL